MELIKRCEKLYLAGEELDRMDLFLEVKMLRNITKENCTRVHTIKFTINNSLSEIYPNMIKALKILLTTFTAVATAERLFSKLKLILKKNYLKLLSI
jgi:hypothetical protein